MARLIPQNSRNWRNPPKIIISCLRWKNSPTIIPELILIPFLRFSQSKITRILFSSNLTFSFVALYLETKTRNSRKVSKSFKNLLNSCWIVVAVHGLVTCYQCLYTLQITFQNYFYPFRFFFKQKIGKENLFVQVESDISLCSK